MEAMEIIAGELYEHYTGKIYRVVTLATAENDGKVMVVYCSESDPNQVYVRPHTQFMSKYKRV
jgi:hypothetical protein